MECNTRVLIYSSIYIYIYNIFKHNYFSASIFNLLYIYLFDKIKLFTMYLLFRDGNI